MLKTKLLLCVIVLAVLLFGCNNQSITDAGQTNISFSFEEFLAQNNFTTMNDGYLFEGDIAFSNEAVEELYQNAVKEGRGNIAINPTTGTRWIWTAAEKQNITYRFTTSMATGYLTDVQVRAAFRAATRAWANAADVFFLEVDSSQVFTVGTYRAYDYATAYSFFPHGPYTYTLQVNLNYVDSTYNTYERMVGLFTHELGHSLGLAHEHQRADSPNQFGQGTYGEAYSTFDSASVMNYANQPYTTGISSGDITLLRYLYQNTAWSAAPTYTDEIPVMTSNTTPSGACTSSSNYDAITYAPWKAFDGNDVSGSASRWISDSSLIFPQWISYEFTVPKVIRNYFIMPEYGSIYDRTPKNFEFQGYYGNNNWVTLDTRTNITTWTSTGYYFTVQTPAQFRRYRLYVTAINRTEPYGVVSLRQVKLFRQIKSDC